MCEVTLCFCRSHRSARSRDNSLTRPPLVLNGRRERSLSRDRVHPHARHHRSDAGDAPTSSRSRQSFMRSTNSSRERFSLRERPRSSSLDRSLASVGSRRRSPSPATCTTDTRTMCAGSVLESSFSFRYIVDFTFRSDSLPTREGAQAERNTTTTVRLAIHTFLYFLFILKLV